MVAFQPQPLRTAEASRRLAGAWFMLALAALGISALLALVLVVARTPFLGFGSGVFRSALVLHVDMAVLVWFLSAASGLWVMARERAGALGWLAFWLSAASVLLLLLSPLTGKALPLLANYMPMLDSRLFQSALALFCSGVLVIALSLLATRWPRGLLLWQQAARWSALVLLLAVLVFLRDNLGKNGVGLTLDQRTWGAGHLLQFLHTLLMLAAWSVVGERLLSRLPMMHRVFPWLMALTTMTAAGGLLVALLVPADSATHRLMFTEIMRWGAWPAAVLLGGGLLYAAWGVRRNIGRLSGDEIALLLSVLLFLAGCLVGAGIRGEDTLSVPAHYHGTVGAVTLAYLLLARRLAVAYNLALTAWSLRLSMLYGAGIAVLVAGLAWSGWLGVVRKAPHAELMQSGAGYLAAMGLAGVGGLLALTAVLLLVTLLLRSAMFSGRGEFMVRRSYWLLALVPLGIGMLLPAMRDTRHATEASRKETLPLVQAREEISLRFKQGVVMLHAQQYEHAQTAFLRVLQLSPEMPEAHVNLGFALLGKQEYGAAAEAFDRASTLRPEQINAYYGLAVAMEGLGNKRAAIESMQAYLHRAPAEDPYRAKAQAAVWEWQEDLRGEPQPAKKGP